MRSALRVIIIACLLSTGSAPAFADHCGANEREVPLPGGGHICVPIPPDPCPPVCD